VASGGSKFLQIQEDGLPVLEYGDITFGTVDMFVRADLNLERVEALRGGSASTFASNSPGGVINMISQTGEVEGGQIRCRPGWITARTAWTFRMAGMPGSRRYHFGGFYRAGTGPRAAGYDGNRGGQIRANVTREFTGGYIRIIGKYLDDRAIALSAQSRPRERQRWRSQLCQHRQFLDQPGYAAFPLYHPQRDAGWQQQPGDRRSARCMHGVVKSIGLESQVSLGGGWHLTDRFRTSAFPAASSAISPRTWTARPASPRQLGGADATLAYASGPRAGQAIANPGGLNGNGLLAQVVVFDTKLNSLDNTTNDLARFGRVDGGHAA
jgi:outer membrane receptor protein involved in Fe transport